MQVSVVVPTLNGREQLAACLDALAANAPGVETVVVNGPSADGTSGMVRDRGDVDVLVEVDERNVNVSRNAGLDRATGDVVAFLDHALAVEADWLDAVRDALGGDAETDGGRRVLLADGGEAAGDPDGADTTPVGAVTGPTHQQLRAGHTTETVETRRIKGRSVTYFDGGNVALRREALSAIDGFDEHLETGGARDAAHRLAGAGYGVTWAPGMCVRREFEADGGRRERDWAGRFRSLSYRLVKNYGLRPSVQYRIGRHAVADAWEALRDVARGEGTPSAWLGNGRDVAVGWALGTKDGLAARWRDRSPTRNPRGWSSRADRAVAVQDWR